MAVFARRPPPGLQRRRSGRPLIGLQPRVDQRHAGLLGERLQHEPLLGRWLGRADTTRKPTFRPALCIGYAQTQPGPSPTRRPRRRAGRAAERAGDLTQRGGRRWPPDPPPAGAGQLDADQLAGASEGTAVPASSAIRRWSPLSPISLDSVSRLCRLDSCALRRRSSASREESVVRCRRTPPADVKGLSTTVPAMTAWDVCAHPDDELGVEAFHVVQAQSDRRGPGLAAITWLTLAS